jgi:hypothetical protein
MRLDAVVVRTKMSEVVDRAIIFFNCRTSTGILGLFLHTRKMDEPLNESDISKRTFPCGVRVQGGTTFTAAAVLLLLLLLLLPQLFLHF